MTANEILELVRAGYSKTEIEAMNGNIEQEKPKEQEQEKPTEKEKPTEQEKPKEDEKKADKGYSELTELVKNLTETVKAMQADNAKKASGEQPKTDTADSVIRSFFGEIPKD